MRPCGTVNFGSRRRFPDDTDDLKTASISEGCELGNLSFTALIRGRDPGIEGHTLFGHVRHKEASY